MAATLLNAKNGRRGQLGFALVLAIFLLALTSFLGLIIGGNGLSARKSARMASFRSAALERAALATWMAADTLEKPQKSSRFVFSIEGRDVAAEVSPESGRIDLNGLPMGGLVQALEELGYDPAVSHQAAEVISTWRGPLQPTLSGSSVTLPDARRAFWSVNDLDSVPNLEPRIRDCFELWGTAHARGGFIRPVLERPLSVVSEIGDAGNIVVGSMVRILVQDRLSGLLFRSVLLYGGGRAMNEASATPWRIVEWLNPTRPLKCETSK